MCSMWMFPRSVPMYNHLLCSGKWMQVILSREKQILYVPINTRCQKVQVVGRYEIFLRYITFRSVCGAMIKSVAISYRTRNRKRLRSSKLKIGENNKPVLMTNLSLWNLRLCTTCGIFWRKFHKCKVSSSVADTNAPSLMRNCNRSTAAHSSCLTCASTPGLPKLFFYGIRLIKGNTNRSRNHKMSSYYATEQHFSISSSRDKK